jgi:hypothetical protein
MPESYFSFALSMELEGEGFVLDEVDDSYNSSLKFFVDLKRNPYFYLLYYVFPSILFIIISYSSFWIDANSVPARIGLSIIIILITIKFT